MKKRNLLEELFRTIKSRLTMEPKTSFYDKVSRSIIMVYEDCFGEQWLAESSFMFFSYRIRKKCN